MNPSNFPLTAILCAVISGIGLAGCGKQTDSSKSPSPSTPSAQNRRVAYHCDTVHPSTAPASSPADDVRGIRLGMPLMLVESELACSDSNYTIALDQGGSFNNLPRLNQDPQPHTSISGDDGHGDKVEVMFVGMPGKEVAARLTRSLGYALSDQPPIDKERQIVVAKYGPPTSDDRGPYLETLNWIYEPSGSPMSPKNPSYNDCTQIGSLGSSFSFSKACGLTIRAAISITANSGVSSVDVAIMNQAATNDALDKEKAAIDIANTPTGQGKPL